MADQVFNIARGKMAYYANEGLDGANSRIVIVALEAAEADDALNDRVSLGAILAAAGNTEATSSGYSRKLHPKAGVSLAVNNGTNSARVAVDNDDTWVAVDRATTEVWVKLLVCYDPDITTGTDADIVPLAHFDFSVTPNGSDIVANYDQSNGVWASV